MILISLFSQGTKYKMQAVDSDGTVAPSLAFKPEDEEREKELLEYHSKQISQVLNFLFFFFFSFSSFF